MIKVLFIIHNIGIGGAPKMMMDIANNLNQGIFNVQILSLNNISQAKYGSYNVNVKCADMDLKKMSYFRRLYKSIKYIKRFVKDNKIDICVSFLSDSNLFSSLANILNRSVTITCERGDPYNDKSKYSRIMQFSYWISNFSVFQSENAKMYFPKFVQKKSFVIPNFISINRKQENIQKKNKNVFVSIGRLDLVQKRQDVLIDAFSKFIKTNPTWKLKLIGSGNDIDLIRRKIYLANLDNFVDIITDVYDVTQYLLDSSCLILSSDFEGMPNVIFEAMVVGTPVISSDYSPGSVKDIIEDGVSGLIFEKGNAQDLLAKMEIIKSDSGMLDYLAQNAYKSIRKYSIDNVIPLWEHMMLDIMNKKRYN